MDDDELRRDFVKVEEWGKDVRILVRMLDWHSRAPESHWLVARTLPSDAPPDRLDAAIDGVLASPDYFATCEECGVRSPLGWMEDDCLCQSCAESDEGGCY